MTPTNPSTNQPNPTAVLSAEQYFTKDAGNGWLNQTMPTMKSCPACHRIHDEIPAGFVTLVGSFLKEHRTELLNLVRSEEARSKAEHPMERIIKIEDQDNDVLVTTTGIHLARGIGEALHHAYKGELEFHYNEQEYLLRVVWTR